MIFLEEVLFQQLFRILQKLQQKSWFLLFQCAERLYDVVLHHSEIVGLTLQLSTLLFKLGDFGPGSHPDVAITLVDFFEEMLD